jgi:hypothetical protein
MSLTSFCGLQFHLTQSPPIRNSQAKARSRCGVQSRLCGFLLELDGERMHSNYQSIDDRGEISRSGSIANALCDMFLVAVRRSSPSLRLNQQVTASEESIESAVHEAASKSDALTGRGLSDGVCHSPIESRYIFSNPRRLQAKSETILELSEQGKVKREDCIKREGQTF